MSHFAASPQTESARKSSSADAAHRAGANGIRLTPPVQSFGASGQPVMQRMLRKSKAADGDMEQVHAADLGAAGVLLDYAQNLDDDTAALVDGRTRQAIAGLTSVLKAAVVTGADLANEATALIMTGELWKQIGDDDKAAMLTHVKRKLRVELEVDGMTIADFIPDFAALDDYSNSHRDVFIEWIIAKLAVAGAATSEAAITAGDALPAAWKPAFVDALYNHTKATWYPAVFVAYIPPFKALLTDINAGAITGFDFVRKYFSNGVYGAEFNVNAPDPKRDKYVNKAVVHTHYAAAGAIPNYAHTKPYAKRYDAGFGYTTVTLANVNTVAAANQAYNAL